jgi:hypothetical protein
MQKLRTNLRQPEWVQQAWPTGFASGLIYRLSEPLPIPYIVLDQLRLTERRYCAPRLYWESSRVRSNSKLPELRTAHEAVGNTRL